MAQQKFENRNIRKLAKVGRGRSVTVTIPIEFIRTLGWKEKQKVVVNLRGKKIIIEDWK